MEHQDTQAEIKIAALEKELSEIRDVGARIALQKFLLLGALRSMIKDYNADVEVLPAYFQALDAIKFCESTP